MTVHSLHLLQSLKKINSCIEPRVFIGLDGRTMIADRYGVHVASAAAIALLARPNHRISGFRAEVSHG